ncbi:MAG: hypothetical protein PHD05_01355 [Sphaerochaetaceae bacterium]|nr:hypothetical protein [Sphaerochaetaceae bacterium]
MLANELTFSKEEAKKIQELSILNPEFKKNLTLIVTAWQLQKISTKNAVDLIREEIGKV